MRFVAALAAAKLGRDDRLIGSHLVLELLRRGLVEAMLLGDRAEGTSLHRRATARDALADEVRRVAAMPLMVTPRPSIVEAAAEMYDRWHSELAPNSSPDWTGLNALLALGLGDEPETGSSALA